MTNPRKWIFGLATFLTVTAGAVVIAQDFWDDESLFAQEEITMDQAVTGTLPEAAKTSDDDLFGALFGEEAAAPAAAPAAPAAADPVFEEPAGDLTPVEAVAADDLGGLFDSVDAVPEVPAELEPATQGAAAADDLFAGFDADPGFGTDAAVDDMLSAGDQDQQVEAAVTDTMAEAGLGDLFAGDLEASPAPAAATPAGGDADFDSLFGEFTAEEPAASPAAAPVAEPAGGADDLFAGFDEPAAAPVAEPAGGADDLFAGFEEPAAAPVAEPAGGADDLFAGFDEPAAAPVAEPAGGVDDLFAGFDEPAAAPVAEPAGGVDDLFAGFDEPAAATVPEKGLPQDEVVAGNASGDDNVDFDALFSEFSEGTAAAEPVTAPRPALPPEPVAVAPVRDVPAPVAYKDELALDDDIFSNLAEEGRRAAAEPPPVALVPAASTVTVVDPSVGTALPREQQQTARPTPVQERPTAAAEVRSPRSQPAVQPEASGRGVADRAAPAVAAPKGTTAFEESERLRRVAQESHALNSLDTADRALEARDYENAIQMYEEALRVLPRRPDLEPARARARTALATAYFRQSVALVEMGELEPALAAAQAAAKYGHKRGPEAVRRIQERMDKPPKEEKPRVTPRWEEPDYQKIDKEIEDWLRRGREAYLTGEYERSIRAFESVLARDPENKEAIRMMRAASSRQLDRSTMELDATRQRMIADVRKTWNSRQYGLFESPINSQAGAQTTVRPNENQEQSILEKMEKIRIPEVSFRQANIRDVLIELQRLSVEFDPAADRANRTGVNIILQLDAGAGASATAETQAAPATDFFAAPPAGGNTAGGASDGVLVTFTALDITLKDALETVIGAADLKYRVRGNIVLVVPSDAADGEIVLRMYDVLPSAMQRIQNLSTAMAGNRPNAPARGGGDFLAMEGGNLAAGGELDLRTFFQDMGVQWPARSSIKFVSGLGKIVVANTQENLAVFESVLSILNVVPYQIEIEARFVEVAQSDVDSLGLEWLLTDNWEIAEMKADGNLPPAARRRVVMNANDGTGGFTGGNRYLSQGGTGTLLANGVMDSVATVSSVLTNPEVTMVLHALQQRGHTDLLSAPKITTQSGQQATIKVVTEYIYPTAFETEGISGDSGEDNVAGGTVGAVVTPLDFQTREVGVILEVLPEVSPEGQMINLLLSPEVVSEPSWRNYGSTYISYDPQGNPVEQQLNMEQPFFHTRKLRTNLLIYNGATVVMGGMITEVRNTVDDSIPFLGELPIVGRLFRSKYEASEKRNLLIFVTARLVDPAGRPLDRERLGVDQGIAERIVGVEN